VESRGTPDPRVYFYRGLSRFRLNDQNTAAKDFQYASDLELSKAGQSYNVPLALERIQGKERATIEYFRRVARQKWNAEQARIRRYEFDIQKAKDQKIYRGIIADATAANNSAANNAGESVVSQMNIPFGAKPVNPFGKFETVDTGTQQHTVTLTVTDENVFKKELDRPIELPQQEKKKPASKNSGVRDSFSNFDFGDLEQGTGNSPFNDAVNDVFQEDAGSKTPAPDVFGNASFDFKPDQNQTDDDSPFGTPSERSNSPAVSDDFGDFGADSTTNSVAPTPGTPQMGMSQPNVSQSGTPQMGMSGENVFSGNSLQSLGSAPKSLGRAFIGLFKGSNSSKSPSVTSSTVPSSTTPSPTTTPKDTPAQNNATEDPFGDF